MRCACDMMRGEMFYEQPGVIQTATKRAGDENDRLYPATPVSGANDPAPEQAAGVAARASPAGGAPCATLGGGGDGHFRAAGGGRDRGDRAACVPYRILIQVMVCIVHFVARKIRMCSKHAIPRRAFNGGGGVANASGASTLWSGSRSAMLRW
jgi:hypothetical protein